MNDVNDLSSLCNVWDDLWPEFSLVFVHVLHNIIFLNSYWVNNVSQILFFVVKMAQWKIKPFGVEYIEFLSGSRLLLHLV